MIFRRAAEGSGCAWWSVRIHVAPIEFEEMVGVWATKILCISRYVRDETGYCGEQHT